MFLSFFFFFFFFFSFFSFSFFFFFFFFFFYFCLRGIRVNNPVHRWDRKVLFSVIIIDFCSPYNQSKMKSIADIINFPATNFRLTWPFISAANFMLTWPFFAAANFLLLVTLCTNDSGHRLDRNVIFAAFTTVFYSAHSQAKRMHSSTFLFPLLLLTLTRVIGLLEKLCLRYSSSVTIALTDSLKPKIRRKQFSVATLMLIWRFSQRFADLLDRFLLQQNCCLLDFFFFFFFFFFFCC